MRARLKKAEIRGAAAGEISEKLRLKGIEAGLLVEELGAVRQDCGRLVQLIRYPNQHPNLESSPGSLDEAFFVLNHGVHKNST